MGQAHLSDKPLSELASAIEEYIHSMDVEAQASRHLQVQREPDKPRETMEVRES